MSSVTTSLLTKHYRKERYEIEKKRGEGEREKEKIFFTKVKKIYSSFKLYHNRQYSFDDFNDLTQNHQSIFT